MFRHLCPTPPPQSREKIPDRLVSSDTEERQYSYSIPLSMRSSSRGRMSGTHQWDGGKGGEKPFRRR